MLTIHEEYLVDEQGNRKAVVVPIGEWQQVLSALEELDDVRAYDEAKSQPSDPLPFELAVKELGKGGRG
jgi:hypothetical protein